MPYWASPDIVPTLKAVGRSYNAPRQWQDWAWDMIERDFATPSVTKIATEAQANSSSEFQDDVVQALDELGLVDADCPENVGHYALLCEGRSDQGTLESAIVTIGLSDPGTGILYNLANGLCDIEEGYSYHEPKLTAENKSNFVRARCDEWLYAVWSGIMPSVLSVEDLFASKPDGSLE